MLTNALLFTLLAVPGAESLGRLSADGQYGAAVELLGRLQSGAGAAAMADRAQLAQLVDSAFASLDEVGVEGVVTSRVKSPESLLAKMARKDLPIDQIHDRLAVRVRVESEDDCYRVLDALHRRFTPIESELDDYIATPKPSGYRSLHTAVRLDRPGYTGSAEFQIRTHAMHADAETGRAAHWRYKAGLLPV